MSGAPPRRAARDAGYVSLLLPMILLLSSLGAVALIDVTAYFAAAARAQSAADAAALAAVTPEGASGPGHGPRTAARRLAEAGGGRLEDCDCRWSTRFVEVRVSVPVTGLVIPRLGARRVVADARAVLTPSEPRGGLARHP